MADPQVLSTLRRKRDEIENAIAAYRAKIKDAERDLSAVAATLRLFELNGEPQQFPGIMAQTPQAGGRYERHGLGTAA
jgi:TATA-box binding protein (TBP) (component of TFIID and TFIIIB)